MVTDHFINIPLLMSLQEN